MLRIITIIMEDIQTQPPAGEQGKKKRRSGKAREEAKALAIAAAAATAAAESEAGLSHEQVEQVQVQVQGVKRKRDDGESESESQEDEQEEEEASSKPPDWQVIGKRIVCTTLSGPVLIRIQISGLESVSEESPVFGLVDTVVGRSSARVSPYRPEAAYAARAYCFWLQSRTPPCGREAVSSRTK
ncbi:hypothetical protein QFC22_006489 [Naganishia vaughanmartiniae]|uniref:Uncharacterized protein n=1 Tax=Naganishia vaughanmartiniae TaxID=1424756 RepID=A0ACC2WKJ8_9TREE|nr:hypothetical protein QFC22_006489 [Naganishia vaughanmartiniae]